MLVQKYWIWLFIISIIFFSYYQTRDIIEISKPKVEKFVGVSNNKTKIKIFNFNTSWCGWSKRFQSEWDDFSNRVKTNNALSHVDAIDVKCDNKNELICEEYNVPGYPFIIIENDGKRIQYKGERTADALIKYILE
jgi:hypothetical protein